MFSGKDSMSNQSRNETSLRDEMRTLKRTPGGQAWKREVQEKLAQLKPAHDKAKKSHEAVMGLKAKIDSHKVQVQELAGSASEARRRRQKNRVPEDEYYGTVTAEEERRHEEEKQRMVRRLEREIQHMEQLYYSYESEDQIAEKEYTKLLQEYEAGKGYLEKLERDLEEHDQEIQALERRIQRAEQEQRDRDRHRRDDDRGPRGPPPGGVGAGTGTGGWSSSAYGASHAQSRGGRSFQPQTYGPSGGGGGGGYAYKTSQRPGATAQPKGRQAGTGAATTTTTTTTNSITGSAGAMPPTRAKAAQSSKPAQRAAGGSHTHAVRR